MIRIRKIFHRYSSREKSLSNYLKSTWGISHSRIDIFQQALRHKSIIGTGKFCYGECNERLELLGDAVLDTVVTDYIFKKFPNQNEGWLTKLRARIVNREMLARVGYSCQLDHYLECSVGSEDSMEKIVGNAVEAWIGAIYLDRGFKPVKKVIETKLLNEWIDLDDVAQNTTDFKSKLIEWAQKNKYSIRFNTLEKLNGESHFECKIDVKGECIGQGAERSKKRAEQRAAQRACELLNL